jgi:hypothetical protein
MKCSKTAQEIITLVGHGEPGASRVLAISEGNTKQVIRSTSAYPLCFTGVLVDGQHGSNALVQGEGQKVFISAKISAGLR